MKQKYFRYGFLDIIDYRNMDKYKVNKNNK